MGLVLTFGLLLGLGAGVAVGVGAGSEASWEAVVTTGWAGTASVAA